MNSNNNWQQFNQTFQNFNQIFQNFPGMNGDNDNSYQPRTCIKCYNETDNIVVENNKPKFYCLKCLKEKSIQLKWEKQMYLLYGLDWKNHEYENFSQELKKEIAKN